MTQAGRRKDGSQYCLLRRIAPVRYLWAQALAYYYVKLHIYHKQTVCVQLHCGTARIRQPQPLLRSKQSIDIFFVLCNMRVEKQGHKNGKLFWRHLEAKDTSSSITSLLKIATASIWQTNIT